VLPYDDCDLEALLSDLAGRGFIERYEVADARYIQIVNFEKHQTPHIKEAESMIPGPPASTVPAPGEPDANTVPAPPVIGIQLLGSGNQEQSLAAARPVRAAPKPKTLRDGDAERFERWYAIYPRHEKRPDAERAWSKVLPDDELTERLIADVEARVVGRKWAEGYVEQPATYLNQRVWEDDIEPVRAVRAAASANGNEPAPPEYFRDLRRKLDAGKAGGA
jgi:hypothetical protein